MEQIFKKDSIDFWEDGFKTVFLTDKPKNAKVKIATFTFAIINGEFYLSDGYSYNKAEPFSPLHKLVAGEDGAAISENTYVWELGQGCNGWYKCNPKYYKTMSKNSVYSVLKKK